MPDHFRSAGAKQAPLKAKPEVHYFQDQDTYALIREKYSLTNMVKWSSLKEKYDAYP
jgi:hypothetical protein